MPYKLKRTHILGITLIVTLFVWGHVLWDHLHGGIPTHYPFHDKDMPGIPNWMGALILPFFTWFLLYRIQKRTNRPHAKDSLKTIGLRFFASAAVAITIAICFMNEIAIVDYIMAAILILSFVFPFYKSEYLLGWVLGSTYTFGAVIPMGFGSILALLFFGLFHIGRLIKNLLKRKA